MNAEFVFWLSATLAVYSYLGYPALLALLGQWLSRPIRSTTGEYFPDTTIIIPVHNEEQVIEQKLRNLDALQYPRTHLTVLIVSDGSTDQTRQRVQAYRGDLQLRLLELPAREGKAAALNRGLENVRSELVVFSDASIMLAADSLHRIVQPFQDESIGCVSGEDHIPGGGGEGLYGRYELYLRNLESRISSIAGASGSFYAMRTALCTPFLPGLAPDFFSVLETVGKGYRAVTEPSAHGTMSSTKSSRGEFRRKVRTLIRGMTALWHGRRLLNPLTSGWFAFVLWSHKFARWMVPFFLVAMLVANLWLLAKPFYLAVGIAQVMFYLAAVLSLVGVQRIRKSLVGKIAAYFTVVHVAILVAWIRYLGGARLEIWEPTKR